MKRLIFIVFIIPITFIFAQKQERRDLISIPLITTFTPSMYDGGIQNWGITQDTSGYIYIANNYGLLEFDGAVWNRFEIPSSTKTRAVAIQKSTNRIFTSGQRQFGYFDRLQDTILYRDLSHLFPEGIQTDEVWDLIPKGKRIYLNINGVVAYYENDKIALYEETQNVEFIYPIDDVIFACSSEGIYVIESDGNLRVSPNSSGKEYRGIIKKGQSYILITYDGEILSYDSKLKILKTPIDKILSEAKVNRVLLLSNGNIAIATQNDGLLIIDEDFNLIHHLTKNKGLNHRTVLSLYEDQFENLWVGLNNGVCVVELGSPFSLINENLGLEGTGYAAITYNGAVFLGTSSGLFSLNKDKSYQLINETEGLVNNTSVVNGDLILSHHEGAFLIKKNRIDQFFDGFGTWEFKALSNGKLLGGGYKGFYLFDRQGTSYALSKKLDGIDESSRIFEFANDSTLWMTHGYKGAFKILLKDTKIKNVTQYGEESGFPSNILISVYKIQGELVFAAETGIYTYNSANDRFKLHPTLNEWFGDSHVSKIRESSNGSIFFIANGKIGTLQKKAIGLYEKEEKKFNRINRYISDDLENLNILDENRILIGAKEGFVLYQKNKSQSRENAFNAFLRKVTIQESDKITSQINSEFFSDFSVKNPRNIKFEFSSPYYDGINEIKYSYKLSPYDKEWAEWSETNWKEYTNLPSNKYEFKIKALNIYDEESQVASYAFTVSPRWYESKTAYIVYSLLIFVGFGVVLYTRERKHQSEKQMIHKVKDQALRSKDEEITAFSEKTSQEIQALKNANLKKEIDHKNSQLASVTMHLLSKNEFVSSIRKKISDAVDSKDDQALKTVIKAIDKNFSNDEAWETFAHHFDQVHGNFFQKLQQEVKLTPQETKLCAYLKMNMSTKDIANLMNITVRGVELARYRLRKKLGINREVNLTSYLNEF